LPPEHLFSYFSLGNDRSQDPVAFERANAKRRTRGVFFSSSGHQSGYRFAPLGEQYLVAGLNPFH